MSLQKIHHQNTPLASCPKVRPFFDNALLKISWGLLLFYHETSLSNHGQSLWIFCSCFLHLKQKMHWSLILHKYIHFVVFTPKHNCLEALWIHGKENFWVFFCILPSKLSEKAEKTGEMGNHYLEPVLKPLQIFRDPGWQNHFQEKQLQQELWQKNPEVCLKIKHRHGATWTRIYCK